MSADHKWIVAVPGAERFRVRFGHSGSAGVVWPPTRVAAESLKTATDADLSLRRVYGYAGGVRHGLHFVSKSRLVYPVSGLCVGEDLHNHVWVEGVGGPHYGVAIPGEGVGGHVDINGSPTARVGPSPLVAAGGLGQAGGFPPPQAGNAGAAAPRKLKGNLGGDDAAAAAQHKKRRPKQRFFFGHSAEVTCLAYNKPRGLCASGQKRSHDGKEKPTVLVWRAGDFELIAALVFHERGICSLGFAPKGDILVSLGLDERDDSPRTTSEVAVWHESAFVKPGADSTKAGFDASTRDAVVLRTPTKVVSAGKNPTFGLSVSFYEHPVTFACYDAGHPASTKPVLKIWTYHHAHETLNGKDATLDRLVKRVFSVAWTLVGNFLLVGTNTGVLYVFEGSSCRKTVDIAGASGPRGPMGGRGGVELTCVIDLVATGEFLVGGSDGCLYVVDAKCAEAGGGGPNGGPSGRKSAASSAAAAVSNPTVRQLRLADFAGPPNSPDLARLLMSTCVPRFSCFALAQADAASAAETEVLVSEDALHRAHVQKKPSATTGSSVGGGKTGSRRPSSRAGGAGGSKPAASGKSGGAAARSGPTSSSEQESSSSSEEEAAVIQHQRALVDPSRVAVGCENSMLLILNLAEQKLEAVIQSSHAGPVEALARHPTQPSFFATGGADGSVRFWNLGFRGGIGKGVVGKVLHFLGRAGLENQPAKIRVANGGQAGGAGRGQLGAESVDPYETFQERYRKGKTRSGAGAVAASAVPARIDYKMRSQMERPPPPPLNGDLQPPPAFGAPPALMELPGNDHGGRGPPQPAYPNANATSPAYPPFPNAPPAYPYPNAPPAGEAPISPVRRPPLMFDAAANDYQYDPTKNRFVESEAPAHVLDVADSKACAVTALAFSESCLAVGFGDGFLRVLEFPSLQAKFVGRLAIEEISCLNFSKDGRMLAAGSWDQNIYVGGSTPTP